MTSFIKKSVKELEGYTSPPQKEFRVKLNQNESPFDVPQKIKDDLAETLKLTPWNRYPINESPQLLQKLAEWHGVDSRQVILGNGSNQLFQTLLTATIAQGDKALYTPPTFSLYHLYMEIYDGQLLEVVHAPEAGYPIQDVIKAIKEQEPKLVFLCTPNNPTGFEMSLDLIESICRASEGLVFVDEAYGEFTNQSAIPLLEKYPNLLVSRTFSKAFSMAGLRFGYFVGRESVIKELRKVNLPYNINIFTEMAALRLLDARNEMQEHISYLKSERNRVYNSLLEMDGVLVLDSSANFLLIKAAGDDNLFELLKQRGVLVRDVSSYPLLDGWQRVTIGFKEENDIFLQALTSIIHGTN